MSLCTLGVHKARSEWFIHQWHLVPFCHALSLPSPWHVSAARWKQVGGCTLALLSGWLWCPSPSALCWEIRRDARLEMCSLPRQTQGDVPGLQPSPWHHRDGQGRPFPRHIPGSSQGTAPNIPSLLRTNPIQTLSSTSPWRGCRRERPAASFRAE